MIMSFTHSLLLFFQTRIYQNDDFKCIEVLVGMVSNKKKSGKIRWKKYIQLNMKSKLYINIVDFKWWIYS